MFSEEFKPKSPDDILNVITIGRLSRPKKTELQTQQTMEDSCKVAEDFMKRITKLPLKMTHFTEQISGLVYRRDTIEKVEALIETGMVDIVAVEDIGRIYRNMRHQIAFVQDMVDRKTTLISVNDGLDTRDPNWETVLSIVAVKHGLYTSDVKKKSSRTSIESFRRGGNVLRLCFGFKRLTLEEALSGRFGPVGLRLAKVTELTSIIKQMIAILKETWSYARVAEWCSENAVPYAPYQTEAWKGHHVRNTLHNPLFLYGERRYQAMIHRRIYATGLCVREVNPNPESIAYPELAHLTAQETAELVELLKNIDDRNRALRNREGHRHKSIHRKNVLFPAQHTRCKICGKVCWHFGLEIMRCPTRQKHRLDCWNRVQFNRSFLREKLIQWLIERLSSEAGAMDKLLAAATETYAKVSDTRESHRERLAADREKLLKKMKRLKRLILDSEDDDSAVERDLRAEFKSMKKRLQKLDLELQGIDALPQPISNDLNLDELRVALPALLKDMSARSKEFSDLLRKIFPMIEVFPIQAIDSTQIWPRARVDFNSNVISGASAEEPVESFTLDLFVPSVQYLHREACVRMKKENPKLSIVKIGAALGISNQSVSRAIKLHDMMLKLGLEEPYRVITEHPIDAARWRDWPEHWKKAPIADHNAENPTPCNHESPTTDETSDGCTKATAV